MMVINACYFLITLISVMFAGHLGHLQLAGSTLANSWSFVSGFSLMVGISGAVETLCGQGYGAKIYNMLGIYLQATCIISLISSIIISIIWWFTEPILILLHQNPNISKHAALYIRYLIPGIFAYGVLQNILRFLQTQSIVVPLMVCSMVTCFMHLGLNYVLVYHTSLGYIGSPIATSITMWISLIMVVVYVKLSNRLVQTWKGFSKDCFHHVYPTFKLAFSSAAMVCLGYWAYETSVLLAGLLHDSETTTPVMAMCVNTSGVAFNLIYGFCAAVSTRVSNEVGARRIKVAKNSTWVALKLTILVALIVVIFLGLGHHLWAGLFTNNAHVIQAFASITPFLTIHIFIDSLQTVLAGVSRGCGWQHMAMFINLGVFYVIALPIAAVLAFVLKLNVQGLWIGLISGTVIRAAAMLLLIVLRKWTALELSSSPQEEI